jgi:cation diffusion facilitator CzcD-associated flavoprotein CzcO
MHLTNTPLTQINSDTVQDASGNVYPADIIVLANGFHLGANLAQLDIKGSQGHSLLEYWGQKEAVSCYKSAAVSEFPNFFLLDGPNSASGHFSVIYTVECQVNYVTKLVCCLGSGLM